jgi:hypothetical protein
MQAARRLKSRLSSLLIIITLVLVITTFTVISPVNRNLVSQSSAYINNNKSNAGIVVMRTSNNYNNNSRNYNRKVSLEQLNAAAATPSSFLVVQKNKHEGSNLTKSTLVIKVNRTLYTSTSSKTNYNDSLGDGILNKGVNIALLAPTFTAAAYDDNSFYAFYNLYSHTLVGTNVTSNLNLLSRKVTDEDTLKASVVMLKLIDNLKLIDPHSHITILTDADVDNGSLFKDNNNNLYDLAILGHQEYVTQQEYDNLKKFVTNGGTMMLLDGNVFYAEVKYNPHTKTESLVKGHWWAFNGKSAWRSIGERWPKETSQWVGSNYLCYRCVSAFGNDLFEYRPHEEQYISNHNDSILLNYDAEIGKAKIDNNRPMIATYELNYQKGKVVALGIFSDDVIGNATFNKFFDRLLTKYARNTGI